jgi:TATA-binding protein-associated factor Taf7
LKNTLYFATLVELPCIIEAMKTLDYFNYFKSQDASQLLYVHAEPKIDNFVELEQQTPQLLQTMINNFWAVRDDISFTEQLYRRGELATKLKVAMDSGSTIYPLDGEKL